MKVINNHILQKRPPKNIKTVQTPPTHLILTNTDPSPKFVGSETVFPFRTRIRTLLFGSRSHTWPAPTDPITSHKPDLSRRNPSHYHPFHSPNPGGISSPELYMPPWSPPPSPFLSPSAPRTTLSSLSSSPAPPLPPLPQLLSSGSPPTRSWSSDSRLRLDSSLTFGNFFGDFFGFLFCWFWFRFDDDGMVGKGMGIRVFIEGWSGFGD